MKWRIKMVVRWEANQDVMLYFIPGFDGFDQFLGDWQYRYTGPNGSRGRGHSSK